MAQWVKVLAAKLYHLGVAPMTHTLERELTSDLHIQVLPICDPASISMEELCSSCWITGSSCLDSLRNRHNFLIPACPILHSH